MARFELFVWNREGKKVLARALIAYGIKLSVDSGFHGDVTLDAKTPELAKHYERDFGAIPIPRRGNGTAPGSDRIRIAHVYARRCPGGYAGAFLGFVRTVNGIAMSV